MLLPQIEMRILYINNKVKIEEYINMQFKQQQQQHKKIKIKTIFNPSSS